MADFGVRPSELQYRKRNYGTLDQHSFLFGPQLRLLRRARIETSFRALFGTVRANGNNAFGSAIGGAIDIPINKRIKWRIQPGIFLICYNGDLERNFRLSTGPVFTFRGRPPSSARQRASPARLNSPSSASSVR